MAYSIHGHVSYILEANSKMSIRQKEKNYKTKYSYVEEVERADFFVFSNKNIS